jgi:thioredoxin
LASLTQALHAPKFMGRYFHQDETMSIKITDDSFDTDVVNSDKPVLVDFWAEWCGPCKQIAPALDELSEELGGKLTIAKLNIDENPGTPSKFGVRGIPTLMLFKDGQVAATKIGALPKNKLQEWIESVL